MSKDNRKVVLVGTGMVGMSYAYALLNQNACDELVLIDLNRERAQGEAMDLNHGLAFSSSHMKITAGDYPDCENADIVVICAGVAQKPGGIPAGPAPAQRQGVPLHRRAGDRIRLQRHLFLVATNPVDIMTRITCALSGFNPRRVLGSGTALDTARLRYLLGNISPSIPGTCTPTSWGNTGTAEFVPWSQAMLATKPILDVCRDSGGRCQVEDMEGSARRSGRGPTDHQAKNATYYGIGMAPGPDHPGDFRGRKQRAHRLCHAAGGIRGKRCFHRCSLHRRPKRHPAGALPLLE